jgi:hypothetical protein
MKTDDLIAELSRRATPVRPLPSPAIRVLVWSLVALGSAAAGILVFGARPDLAMAIQDRVFLATALLALGASILAAAAALVLAIPGAERSPAVRGFALSFVTLWMFALVASIVRAGHGLTGDAHWPICFIRVVGIGLLPAVALFVMLRRSAPLRLAWTSGLAAVAAMAIGAVAVQVICPINDSGHALLGHLGPVLTLGGAGAATARRLLNAP